MRQRLLYLALFALYLLHNDLWFWHDSQLLAGLPIGLSYHIGFCLLASLLMAGLVKWAWPHQLLDDAKPGQRS